MIRLFILIVLVSCGKGPNSKSLDATIPSANIGQEETRLIRISAQFELTLDYIEDNQQKSMRCHSPCDFSWITNDATFKIDHMDNSQMIKIWVDGSLFLDATVSNLNPVTYKI